MKKKKKKKEGGLSEILSWKQPPVAAGNGADENREIASNQHSSSLQEQNNELKDAEGNWRARRLFSVVEPLLTTQQHFTLHIVTLSMVHVKMWTMQL